jgi:uncharacterized protein YunC (DUF1805 family)
MLEHKKIKIGNRYVQGICLPLSKKNLIVLVGRHGYVMCGYLNLRAAQKFQDAAVKVVGVSNIAGALRAKVASCTTAAKKKGIYAGQPVRQVLKIIA